MPDAEREFVARVAALVQAVALFHLTSASRDDAQGHAADAFRLRIALGDRTPLDVLETFALGVFAGLVKEARAYLRTREPAEVRDVDRWDERILAVLTQAWWALEAEGNAERALVHTSSLYAEQGPREKAYLDAMRQAGRERAGVWRLVSLYHLAQAPHDIAMYRLTGLPYPVAEKVDMHFEEAFRTADPELANLLGWLRAAAPYETPND